MNCQIFSIKNIIKNYFSLPLDKEDEGNRQRVADFETTMEHAGIYVEYASNDTDSRY